MSGRNSGRLLALTVLALCLLGSGCARAAKLRDTAAAPEPLISFIRPLEWQTLGGRRPDVAVEEKGPGLFRIRATIELESPVQQDDWMVVVRPAFVPNLHWAPHLSPSPEFIIDQHAFRSPALVAASKTKVVALVPDLDIMKQGTPVRWYMDLDAGTNVLVLGMSDSRVEPGLFFARKPGAVYPAGRLEVGFWLVVSSDEADVRDPWRKPLAFMWEKWGRPLF